jgi:hypothetical protein
MIKKLNEAFIRKITANFYSKNNINAIKEIVREKVITKIKESDTWQSLANGGPEGLDAHFGISKNELANRLETILNIWANQIEVRPQNIKRQPRQFSFSYRFYAIRADWADVLSSRAGVTINDSVNARKGKTVGEIPWLEWLLISGDGIEIEDYHIEFGNFDARTSRSGKAFMRPKMSWKVPKEYGPFTSDNNFVTRALAELTKDTNFKSELITAFEKIAKTTTISSTSSPLDNIETGEI